MNIAKAIIQLYKPVLFKVNNVYCHDSAAVDRLSHRRWTNNRSERAFSGSERFKVPTAVGNSHEGNTAGRGVFFLYFKFWNQRRNVIDVKDNFEDLKTVQLGKCVNLN